MLRWWLYWDVCTPNFAVRAEWNTGRHLATQKLTLKNIKIHNEEIPRTVIGKIIIYNTKYLKKKKSSCSRTNWPINLPTIIKNPSCNCQCFQFLSPRHEKCLAFEMILLVIWNTCKDGYQIVIGSKVLLFWALSSDYSPRFLWKTWPLSPIWLGKKAEDRRISKYQKHNTMTMEYQICHEMTEQA